MPASSLKNRAPALVIGLDSFTGVQTARILASNRIPVIGVAADPGHFCCRTRVCSRQIYTDTAGEALVESLARLGPTLPAKAVCYPCNDLSVAVLSAHRDVLSPWFHIALPAPETVSLLMDKMAFINHALQAGLPVPPTFFLRSRADAVAAAAELQFPCILKPPRKTVMWEANAPEKAFKAENREHLLSLYARYAPYADLLMAQQWVAGTDADLYSCNCYFNKAGEPVASFVARKLRQWPPEAGTSCLGEEVRNDVVRQVTIDLFRSVTFHGLGYVEMKRDAGSGEHFIIEPNIGRPTGRSAIAEAGGVPLLYTMYCDVTGQPIPEPLEQRYTGVKWVYLRRDFQSAFYYWRRGDLSLRQWLGSLRGRKAYALFSWRDPGPFIGDLARVVRLAFKKKARKRVHQPAQQAAAVRQAS